MRKVANEIEYSPTTIYRYYKDKDSLLTAIIRRNQIEITRRFQIILDDVSLNPLVKLKYLISAYIKFCLEFEDTYKLYTKLCSIEIHDNRLYEIIGGEKYRIFSSWQDQIETLISEGMISCNKSIDIIILIWHITHRYISNRISVILSTDKTSYQVIDFPAFLRLFMNFNNSRLFHSISMGNEPKTQTG